jgi:general secretion pathway protein E
MHDALTPSEVLGWLVREGVLDETGARDARLREPAQRARLTKESVGGPSGRAAIARVTTPEVLAAMRLQRADGRGTLTEEAIVQIVAEALDLPWRRLDPLELDLAVVTRAFSRPFARRNACVAVAEQGAALIVAVAEPRDKELFEALRRHTGRDIRVVLAAKGDIMRIIGEFYGFKSTLQAAEREFSRADDVSNLEQLFRLKTDAELEATDQSIVSAVDFLLRNALDQRASDLHFEPKRAEGTVRYRIDGLLHTVHRLPRALVPAVTSRMKMMARLDIAERRKPQDGRIKLSLGGREIEIRVSTMPTVFGEKVVMRFFDPDLLLQDLGGLGFSEPQLETWRDFVTRPHGIVLVTGPTGSGKTTTLYSTLRTIAVPEVNVVTIEDPIEMVTDAFNQMQIDPRLDVTFSSALRNVLRQDPDIIMVGEIRDGETARYAVQAALTGHLVFSTLHTNDAASAFSRLYDLGVEPFLLSSTLIGVAAQRLVRLNCPHCSVETNLTADQVGMLGLALLEGAAEGLPVREGQGCLECRGTGFMGRGGVYELLSVTPTIRGLVHRGADSHEIRAAARREGLMTLHEAAVRRLALGETTFEEVYRVTTGVNA